MSHFTSNIFSPLNKLEFSLLLTFQLIICRTKTKRTEKRPNARITDTHFLNLLLVRSHSVPVCCLSTGIGREGMFPLGLASWTISPRKDMHQDHHKWIYKTVKQVKGYNLLFVALQHYIGSAVIWNFILTYLSLRKPFKCLKSRRCIKKKPCKCDAEVIY